MKKNKKKIKKIRLSTFETNSSSLHTLIISEDNDFVSEDELDACRKELELILSEEGIDTNKKFYIPMTSNIFRLTNFSGSWDREFSMFTDWKDKLIYILSEEFDYFIGSGMDDYAIADDHEYWYSSVIKAVQKVFPNFLGLEANFDMILDDTMEEVDKDLNIVGKKISELNQLEKIEFPINGFLYRTEFDCGTTESVHRTGRRGILATRFKKLKKYKKLSIEDFLKEVIFNKAFIIMKDDDSLTTFEPLVHLGYLNLSKIKYFLNDEYDSKKKKCNYKFVNIKNYFDKDKERDDSAR